MSKFRPILIIRMQRSMRAVLFQDLSCRFKCFCRWWVGALSSCKHGETDARISVTLRSRDKTCDWTGAVSSCPSLRFTVLHNAFKQHTSLKSREPNPQHRPRLRCKPIRIGMRKLAHEGQDGHVCQAGLLATQPTLAQTWF